jgi:DNA-directed RNA polymerase subunit RPC12/RpoP
VLHDQPFSIFFGAIATMGLLMLIPVSMLASALLLLSAEFPEHFAWVPKGLLVMPMALPMLGIAYFVLGIGCKCRVCGQKLFVHHRHLKNSKAHRIPGFGYILPLCVHILLFRWFRCPHCGTAIRVKE